jgi:uncharacterized RDD family membrane protein YckC
MSESGLGGGPSPAAGGQQPPYAPPPQYESPPSQASAPVPPVEWTPPPPEPGPAPGVAWAGYAERLVAYLLDGLIVSVILLAFVLIFGGAAAAVGGVPRSNSLSPGATAFGLVGVLVVIVVPIAYFPFFWARSGQTPGMRPFGIRVVRDADGGRLTTGGAILRLLGMWVSALVLYIGFVWVFIDRRRRGWHDLIGGTVVIKDASRG